MGKSFLNGRLNLENDRPLTQPTKNDIAKLNALSPEDRSQANLEIIIDWYQERGRQISKRFMITPGFTRD